MDHLVPSSFPQLGLVSVWVAHLVRVAPSPHHSKIRPNKEEGSGGVGHLVRLAPPPPPPCRVQI